MTSHTNGPFRLDVPVDWPAFREALAEARYLPADVAPIFDAARPGGCWNLDVALRRTAEPGCQHTLARLFMLHRPVPAEAVRQALAPVPIEPLIATGLLEPTDAGLRAQALLMPHEQALALHDFDTLLTGRPIRPDHVLGVGHATMTLAQLTVRRPIERALDLGTGSGFQALLAARHARRVIGTDICRRALNFAALAARINGHTNIELRQGNLFEPAGDQPFDLIVSNPPFVISPQAQYTYRDGGMSGDELCRQVLQGACRRLTEGGFATLELNWIHEREDQWDQPLCQWLDGLGCDAWLLRMQSHDALGYAVEWLSDVMHRDPADFARQLEQWLEYFQKLNVQRISRGVAIVRKRTAGRNWIRSNTVPDECHGVARSDQIERIFAARDLIETLGDDRKLLDVPLTLVDEHQLDYALKLRDGKWRLSQARLRLTEGFGFDAEIPESIALLLSDCDGRRPLKAVIADLAPRLGSTVEQITPTCLAAARALLETGFLVPPPAPAAVRYP